MEIDESFPTQLPFNLESKELNDARAKIISDVVSIHNATKYGASADPEANPYSSIDNYTQVAIPKLEEYNQLATSENRQPLSANEALKLMTNYIESGLNSINSYPANTVRALWDTYSRIVTIEVLKNKSFSE